MSDAIERKQEEHLEVMIRRLWEFVADDGAEQDALRSISGLAAYVGPRAQEPNGTGGKA